MNNLRLLAHDVYDWIIQAFQRRCLSILMYHSIGDNKHFFTVPTEEFEWQMSALRKSGRNIIILSDVVAMLRNRQSIPFGTVAVTFDDGYEDNITNALPILLRHRIPATIFIPTGLIGTTREVRGIALRHATQVQLMAAVHTGLVELGSHGTSHRRFTELSANELSDELVSSHRILSDIAGSTATLLAYPFGASNERVQASASQVYSAAVGVARGWTGSGENLFNLPRHSVDSLVSRTRFLLKL